MSLIRNIIRLGAVMLSGRDESSTPTQQVSYRDKSGNSVAWYAYGFHANAMPDSYCVILPLNGNPEERVHIPTSFDKRPKLTPGEVAVFSPESGTTIILGIDGTIKIDAKSDVLLTSPTLVRVEAPLVEIEGDLDVSGNVGIGGDLLVALETTLTGDVTIISEEVTSGLAYIGGRHEHPENTGDGFTEGPVDNG